MVTVSQTGVTSTNIDVFFPMNLKKKSESVSSGSSSTQTELTFKVKMVLCDFARLTRDIF